MVSQINERKIDYSIKGLLDCHQQINKIRSHTAYLTSGKIPSGMKV